MKHHLGNFPKCETCTDYDGEMGSCHELHETFICDRIKKHIENIKNEILAKVEKDKKKMGGDLAYYMDVRDILGKEAVSQ